MLIDKWRPLYAPETETGTGEAEGKAPPSGTGTEGQEDTRRLGGRSELRKQLEKNFETDRKTERSDGRTAEGRFVRGAASKEADADEGAEQVEGKDHAETGEQEAEGEQQETQETEEQKAAAKAAGTAPEGWSKEAKAEWLKLPAQVQAAVKKRETDMAKGVEELKGRYSEIDQAIAPHMDAVRRAGHTPGKAVAQLFAWFAALTANPQAAFPALAKSFGHEPDKVMEWLGFKPEGKAPDQQEQKTQPQTDIPPALQSFIDGMKQEIQGLKGEITNKFGALETNFAASSQQKAEETLAIWSKDKPHFDKVRAIMAELIGRGLVPLKEGKYVDLDAAYDKALYYDPAIREEVLAEQRKATDDARKAKEAAEKKAQQERADKARRANVGLGPSAPGTAVAQGGQKAKGKSVRESLQEAIESNRA